MARNRKVVFFGNCQAQALATVYRAHFGSAVGDDVAYADSHNVLTDPEFATRALSEADVVVSQVFDFPAPLKAEDLQPHCITCRFPSVVAGFYWPYASQPHIETPKDDPEPPYPAQLGDRYLNGLIAKGVAPEAALEQYLELDIAKAANADRLLELGLDKQRKRDAEAGMDIATRLEQRFRSEPLFLTPDHPSLEVFSWVARQVYPQLGNAEAEVEDALKIEPRAPFPRSALPIHPRLAEHFGLEFANAGTRYPYFEEGAFTFAEYVLRYMRYEWNADLRKGIHDGSLPYEQRAPLLAKALEASPNSADGWRVLGEQHLRHSDPNWAREAARKAYAADPADPEIWRLLAEIEIFDKNVKRAEAICGLAIAKFPYAPSLRHVMTRIARAAENTALAVESAQQAARLRRGDATQQEFLERTIRWAEARAGAAPPEIDIEAECAKAEALERAGDAAAAVAILERVIKQRPGDAHLVARLGNLYLRQRNPAAAEAKFRAAIALDPDFPAFRNGLAIGLLDLGRLDECDAIIRPLAARGLRDPHIYATLARLQTQRNELEQAEATLRAAIAVDPSLYGLHVALADICWRAGRQPEAVAVLDGLVSRGVEDPAVLMRLGLFEGRRGRLPRAEALLRRVVAADPANLEFKLRLTELLILERKFADAEAVLAEIEATGRHAAEIQAARALIQRLAAR